MLAIGRAFMSGRKIMLLDEPSMWLAPLLMMNVFDALREINQEGTAILLVEQKTERPACASVCTAGICAGKRQSCAGRGFRRASQQ
jgi:ABC-type branched-subunit amino acid transport system ATPase component